MDRQSLRQGLDRLAQLFVKQVAVGDVLQRVADLARLAFDEADVVGVTWLNQAGPASARLAGNDGAEVPTATLDVADGPGVEAARRQLVCRIETIGEDERWPAFSKLAASLGVCSTLSAPLVAGGESFGALNLYSRSRPFTAAHEELGSLFTHPAGVVLGNTRAYWEARELNEHLNEAMRYRAAIEQAKGILMAAGGRNPDDAFNVLVRASQRENRKLRELAVEIVLRAQRQPVRSNDGHARSSTLE